MNEMLNSFVNFYDNLSSDGVFFFWIIVFLFSFLIFLSVMLFIKNNKLSKLLKEKMILDNIQKNDNAEQEKKEEDKLEILLVNKEKEEEENAEKKESANIVKENLPYQKNILRQMNARMQTSPIHIEKNDISDLTNLDFDSKKDTLGIDLGEDMSCPLEEMEDVYEVNDNMMFASEIVSKMEKEIKPSNIELTEYEKKQEEEAIISYDELLKVKDKIYNITEDEETDEFIDELKSFRLNLQ